MRSPFASPTQGPPSEACSSSPIKDDTFQQHWVRGQERGPSHAKNLMSACHQRYE